MRGAGSDNELVAIDGGRTADTMGITELVLEVAGPDKCMVENVTGGNAGEDSFHPDIL